MQSSKSRLPEKPHLHILRKTCKVLTAKVFLGVCPRWHPGWMSALVFVLSHPDADVGDLSGSTSTRTEKTRHFRNSQARWNKALKRGTRSLFAISFNDLKAPEGWTCLDAAEEEQVPALVSECQREGVAAGAGGGMSHLQQGMKGDPGASGQRDAGKWMEVGTIKEMSRLKRSLGVREVWEEGQVSPWGKQTWMQEWNAVGGKGWTWSEISLKLVERLPFRRE